MYWSILKTFKENDDVMGNWLKVATILLLLIDNKIDI